LKELESFSNKAQGGAIGLPEEVFYKSPSWIKLEGLVHNYHKQALDETGI
jgi:hypothetical protein